jgi:hypothetical protein
MNRTSGENDGALRPGEDGVVRDFVLDGGVLDNIPVDWAVRSIAAAPADRTVVRWLVYLQPVPFTHPSAPERRVPNLVATVLRARSLRGGTEALADDLDELEQLRRDILRRQGFRQVLEYALGQLPQGGDRTQFLPALFDRALAAVDTYRERAGAMEASRVRSLWIDPLPVLAADPLGFSEVTRAPLAGLDSQRSEQLLAALATVGPDLVLGKEEPGLGPHALERLLHQFRSPQVLARTVAVLLDAARELGEPGFEIKRGLYVLRGEIEVLVAHADRALAAEPQRSREILNPVEIIRRSLWRPNEPKEDWPDWTNLWQQLVEHALRLADVAHKLPAEPRVFIGCLLGAAADERNPPWQRLPCSRRLSC